MTKDLGREQWEAKKRAKELHHALEVAAGEKELAFLKGRLEGLATVVTGVATERSAAAELRTRAEAAEASLSGLQVRHCLAGPHLCVYSSTGTCILTPCTFPVIGKQSSRVAQKIIADCQVPPWHMCCPAVLPSATSHA